MSKRIRGFSMPGTISVRGQLEEQKTLGLLAGENWHTGRARERSDRKTIEKERYPRAQDTAIERVQAGMQLESRWQIRMLPGMEEGGRENQLPERPGLSLLFDSYLFSG